MWKWRNPRTHSSQIRESWNSNNKSSSIDGIHCNHMLRISCITWQKPPNEPPSYASVIQHQQRKYTLRGAILQLLKFSGPFWNISLANKPRLPWVDAICFNQLDIRPRNRQVWQMRAIYEKALSMIRRRRWCRHSNFVSEERLIVLTMELRSMI